MTDTLRAARALCSALLWGAFAVGCASLPESSPRIPALKARTVATSFMITGRIAARDTGDTKRGFSGGFSWNHKPETEVVELFTPLGTIAARVTISAFGTDIELADGQRATTRDPEQYLSRALGITMPLMALPYWMQAAPVPSLASRTEADPLGRPSALSQSGWQIRYTEYADASPDAYPTRIELVQGDIEARMIISEWKAP